MSVNVSVNVSQVVRQVNDHVLGVNIAYWDPLLDPTTNPQAASTEVLAAAAGLTMIRFPGGSDSDDWHFTSATSYGGEGTAAHTWPSSPRN